MVDWNAKRKKAGMNIVRQGAKTFINPSVANVANLAWKGVKGIRALINAEKHLSDSTYNTTLVTNASGATIIDFTNIAVGDTQSTRTGNSILVNSVYGKMKFTTTAIAPNQVIRYMLVEDRQQTSDTAPTAASILENLTYSDVCPLNRQILGRYKIHFDRKVQLDAYHPQKEVKFFKHFKRHHFRYNGTSNTDIQKGGLYLFVFTQETTNMPSMESYCTCAFYDN